MMSIYNICMYGVCVCVCVYLRPSRPVEGPLSDHTWVAVGTLCVLPALPYTLAV